MEQKRAIHIKYDQATMKVLKWVSIVCFVLILSGNGMIFFDTVISENAIIGGLFYLISVYMGVPVFLVSVVNFISGKCYFRRLKKYGYEIPYRKKDYGNLLENLPRSREVALQGETSLCSKDSKLLFFLALGCYAVFMLLDVRYYFKWNFVPDDALSRTIFQGIFFSVVWLVLSFTALRQSHPEKYRDDVESDMTRKERKSFENGLIEYIVLCFVCIILNTMANSMTAYVFSSRVEADRDTSQMIAMETALILDSYMVDGKFADEECLETYVQLLEGAEVTTWTEPSDSLQQQIMDYVSSVIDNYQLTEGPPRISIRVTDGSADVHILNLIPQALEKGL